MYKKLSLNIFSHLIFRILHLIIEYLSIRLCVSANKFLMRVKDKIYFNCLEQKLHKPNVRAVKFQRKFHPKFNTSSRVDFHHAFQRTSTHCRDCTILRVGQLLCQRWPRNVVPRKEGSGRMWYSESFVHGRNCASGASGRL